MLKEGLPPGTIVDTSDPIERCKVGFSVFGFKEEDGSFFITKVAVFEEVGPQYHMRELTAENGRILVAPLGLYLLVAERGWEPVGALREGDMVGTMVPVQTFAYLGHPPQKLVYTAIKEIADLFAPRGSWLKRLSPSGKFYYLVTEAKSFVAERFVVRFE